MPDDRYFHMFSRLSGGKSSLSVLKMTCKVFRERVGGLVLVHCCAYFVQVLGDPYFEFLLRVADVAHVAVFAFRFVDDYAFPAFPAKHAFSVDF